MAKNEKIDHFQALLLIGLSFALFACATRVASSTETSTVQPTLLPPTTRSSSYSPAADKAQKTLTLSEQAILDDTEKLETHLSQYSLLYRAAFYAAWNAILYFPEDPRAETWQWKLAYYAAMGGDSNFAAKIYTKKITGVLNGGHVRIEDLPTWFQSGELEVNYMTPHFKLELQTINNPDSRSSYLIQLGVQGGIDVPGLMCLLVAENENKAETYLVYDGFPEGGFFPTLRHPSYCTLEDATGDGIDEVIAHNWSGGHVGTSTLQVIDITTLPPKILPFNSSKDENVSAWNGSAGDLINNNGKIQIPMSEKLGQCDIYLTKYFEWNGDWFEPSNLSLELADGGFNSLKGCYYYIPYRSEQLSTLNAIQVLDQAIKIYSPGSESDKDVLEEFRIEKGLIYLFSGNPDKALDVFNEIASTPIKQDGIWVTPVRNFLKTYRESSDLYRACTVLTTCDPNRPTMAEDPNYPSCATTNPCQTQALNYVLANQSTSQPLEGFTSNLRSVGVDITTEGWVDIDNDGKNELWFTVTPPTHTYFDFWVVTDYPNGIQTFYLGAFPTAYPEFKIKTLASGKTTIEIGLPRIFIWARDRATNEPSLSSVNKWQDVNLDYTAINSDLKEFERIASQLYFSNNPARIYKELLAIANRYDVCPYQLSSPETNFYKFECGNYYYIIGFAAELANDNDMAQKMYATVTEQYPNNPIALLAKSKLNQ